MVGRWLLLGALVLVACGGGSNAGTPEAGVAAVADAAAPVPDATVPETGVAADAAAQDTGMPDAGREAPAPPDAPDVGSDQAIDVADAPTARLTADTDTLELSLPVGCAAKKKVRISNTGKAASGPLVVTTADPFSIAATTCIGVALPPSGACDIDVQFKPTSMGAKLGSLMVSAGDASVTVALHGVGLGISSAYGVRGLDFGSVRLGRTVSLKTEVSLLSVYPEPISIYASITGQDFTIIKDACKGTFVKPGGWCELEVSFAPSVLGARSGALTVQSPSCGGPVQEQVKGSGAPPPAGTLIIDRGAIDFGTIPVRCWRPATVHVANTGQAATEPLAVAVTGQFVPGVDGCSGKALPAGGSCDLEVLFQPVSPTGVRQGTLTVTAGSQMDQIPLSGTASVREAALEPRPDRLNFGEVPLGSTSQRQRVVFSTWHGAAELSGITTKIAGDDFQIIEDLCTGLPVRGGATCAVDVVFKPKSSLRRTGELIVTAPVRDCTPDETHIPLEGYSPP